MAKIPDAGLKWRNQGAGRDCQEGTTKLGKGGERRLGHVPSHVTHTPGRGGYHKGEVKRVEACDTQVVARVVAGV